MDYNIIKKDRFDKVWDQIVAAGLGTQLYPEEAKLRMQVPLENGKGQYTFNLTKEALADNLKNFVLQDNDVFVPNAIGVLIGITETATGIQKLYPYAPKAPNGVPSIYAAGFESDAPEAIYNGHLSWKMGTQILLNQYPLEKFKKVPRQQGDVFVLDSQDAPVHECTESEWSIDKCLELLMPKYTIAGNRDHFVTVNFDAAGLTFPVTSGYTAQIVLFLDGFLVKGGATTIDGKRAFDDAPARF